VPEPITRKVLLAIHNPILRSQGGITLREYFRWNDPDALARDYSQDVRNASWGYANYEIAERMVVDAFPLKADGYRYDERAYLNAWRRGRFHQPDLVDYGALVRQLDVVDRVRAGEVDEVWLMGFPYCGYYESVMGGPGAFWCNGPELRGTESAGRRFVVMGFNYERGVGEMLEDLGHRAESILSRVFSGAQGEADLFARFTRYDKAYPGQAECGNVHFAPNSLADYDWGNRRPVLSRCDAWRSFPDLSAPPREVDCSEWGDGNIRLHHLWWLRRFPHVDGQTGGIAHNWWQYVIDPDSVPGSSERW
jgi:hypothetical protein